MIDQHKKLASDPEATPRENRRFSRNDYTYQILEQIDLAEIRNLLNELSTQDLKSITAVLHIRDLPHGAIGNSQADLVQSTALRLYAAGAVRHLIDRFTRDVSQRATVELGKHFANPSKRRIAKLTNVLLEQFGPLKTKMYYADAIDGEARASRHLLRELSRRPEMSINLHLHDESPIDLVSPKPAPTEELKSSRKQRRATDKQVRAQRRSQTKYSRELERRRKKDRPRSTSEDVSVVPDQPTQAPTIQETKLQHGHLRRYRKASTSHPDTGSIKSAFVSFEKDDPTEGKVRPCVIVAVAPNYYIVRPIYSRASYFAGAWRAVVLADWHEAGLDHESVVGHKTYKIRLMHVSRHVGRLSLKDWNRVCRGEVNEVANP
jgi:hypothetical protein